MYDPCCGKVINASPCGSGCSSCAAGGTITQTAAVAAEGDQVTPAAATAEPAAPAPAAAPVEESYCDLPGVWVNRPAYCRRTVAYTVSSTVMEQQERTRLVTYNVTEMLLRNVSVRSRSPSPRWLPKK